MLYDLFKKLYSRHINQMPRQNQSPSGHSQFAAPVMCVCFELLLVHCVSFLFAGVGSSNSFGFGLWRQSIEKRSNCQNNRQMSGPKEHVANGAQTANWQLLKNDLNVHKLIVGIYTSRAHLLPLVSRLVYWNLCNTTQIFYLITFSSFVRKHGSESDLEASNRNRHLHLWQWNGPVWYFNS